MTKKRPKKNQWHEGDIVCIDLGDGMYGFGRVLKSPLMAFYNLSGAKSLDAREIIEAPVLFKVWVMKYAITDGDWPVIGHVSLSGDLLDLPTFYKRDSISKKLTIYRDSKESSTTFEQCKGLEKAAVWNPEHVVDRLRDHFAGRPNKWVESLKL